MSKHKSNSPISSKSNKKLKTLYGYTNELNPFNDNNLTSVFVWNKKNENISDIKKRQKEAYIEIEKVKNKREERENEKLLQKQLREKQQRESLKEDIELLNKKEEEFHLNQAKIKAELRIAAGRETITDIFTKNLYLYLSEKVPNPKLLPHEDIELAEPYSIFDELKDIPLLESTQSELGYFLGLGANREYWQALVLLCDDELSNLKEKSNDTNISGSAKIDIKLFLLSKTKSELKQIRNAIQRKLNDSMNNITHNVSATDVEYWEYLLKKISVYEARSYMKDFHISMLKKRLYQLKNSDIKDEVVELIVNPEEELKKQNEKLLKIASSYDNMITSVVNDDDFSLDIEEIKKIGQDAASINYEPELIAFSDIDPKVVVVDPVDDLENLMKDRLRIFDLIENQLIAAGELNHVEVNSLFEHNKREESRSKVSMSRLLKFAVPEFETSNKPKDYSSLEDALMRQEEMIGMGEGESGFGVQVAMAEKGYLWQNKYQPRKPRFFNRVKTGFEWNKYNATHYDHENPPPKHVMGYKFNIFYPDLIDPSTTPIYILENAESPDFCIIRFQSGPPYEDIAFKLVNKEWDTDQSRGGFRCCFENGVFKLWFNFRKYKFRR